MNQGVEFGITSGRTTLESVVVDVVASLGDRVAISQFDPVGILVLSMGSDAIGSIAETIRLFVENEADVIKGADTDRKVPLTDQTAVQEIFLETGRLPHGWLFFQLQYFDVPVIGFCMVGKKAHQVAQICHSNGCPISLDPNVPPPGWEIGNTVTR